MPVAERGSRGRPSWYSLAAVVAWYISRELTARGVGDTPIDPQVEKALLDRRRREQLELKLAEERGLVVRREQVLREGTGIVIAVRARLLVLAHRLVQDGLVAPENKAAVARHCLELLQEMARWQPTDIAKFQTRGEEIE